VLLVLRSIVRWCVFLFIGRWCVDDGLLFFCEGVRVDCMDVVGCDVLVVMWLWFGLVCVVW